MPRTSARAPTGPARPRAPEGTVTIYGTCASRDEARAIAMTLLRKRLIACANLAPIESFYWWKGSIEGAQEWAMILKTTSARARAALAVFARLHSYDVPGAVVLPHSGALDPYAAWIRRETRTRAPRAPSKKRKGRTAAKAAAGPAGRRLRAGRQPRSRT
ncbi:MAG: divalent-cation tolerance protein CutA [Thermoplasmatota archaeon]